MLPLTETQCFQLLVSAKAIQAQTALAFDCIDDDPMYSDAWSALNRIDAEAQALEATMTEAIASRPVVLSYPEPLLSPKESHMSRHVTIDYRAIARESVYWQLADVGDEVPCPYAEAIAALDAARATLVELRSHSHQWDRDGFCVVCSADGNA